MQTILLQPLPPAPALEALSPDYTLVKFFFFPIMVVFRVFLTPNVEIKCKNSNHSCSLLTVSGEKAFQSSVVLKNKEVSGTEDLWTATKTVQK